MSTMITAPGGSILATLARMQRPGPSGTAATHALHLRQAADTDVNLPAEQSEALADAVTEAVAAVRQGASPDEVHRLLNTVVLDAYVLAELAGVDLEGSDR